MRNQTFSLLLLLLAATTVVVPFAPPLSPLATGVAKANSLSLGHVVDIVSPPHDDPGSFCRTRRGTRLRFYPEGVDAVSASSLLLSKDAAYFAAKLLSREVLTSLLAFLFLFAGLLFALVSSNLKLFAELTGGGDEVGSDEPLPKALEGAPTITLPLSKPLPLPAVAAVLSKIRVSDDIGDWEAYRRRVQAKVSSPLTLEDSCKWVLREDFRDTIRSRRGGSWPVSADGSPFGGEAARKEYEGWMKAKPSEIPTDVLDAVFDTWAGRGDVSERAKVDEVLGAVFKEERFFDEKAFEGAVLKQKALRGSGIVTFVVIQLVLAKAFFVPAIADFFEL